MERWERTRRSWACSELSCRLVSLSGPAPASGSCLSRCVFSIYSLVPSCSPSLAKAVPYSTRCEPKLALDSPSLYRMPLAGFRSFCLIQLAESHHDVSPLSHNVCFCPRLSGGCLGSSLRFFAPPGCKNACMIKAL